MPAIPANETQQKMFLCLGISGYIALQGVEVNILIMTRMKKNAKDYRPEPSQPLCVMAPVSGEINVKLNHVSYFSNLCTP